MIGKRLSVFLFSAIMTKKTSALAWAIGDAVGAPKMGPVYTIYSELAFICYC
jgi:hypothetical protein